MSLLDDMNTVITRVGRYVKRRLVTPCCGAPAVLGGKPAPRYTCRRCGVEVGLWDLHVEER